MNNQSNIIELFGHRRCIADDEDFLVLLDRGHDYICYVRNYVAATEFIVVSNSIVSKLPEDLRPVSNVFVQSHFHALRQFKEEVRRFLTSESENGLGLFYYFFNCSISAFFDSL